MRDIDVNDPRILLVGLGGFGRNHLRAWHEMGFGRNLYVAELNPDRHNECQVFNLPAQQIATDYRDFLNTADIVDIVTPSVSHFDVIIHALKAGKDVFVEKPMTMTSTEAAEVERLVRSTGRLLQVGYYYRCHPIARYAKQQISTDIGAVRYMSGNFMGFKRARTDVGVTHTDGIHFIDLFNWLLGALPRSVYAVTRDHWERQMDDLSIAILQYADGTLAKVESGYIQPGRWRDKVVPNAVTSKEFFVCGSNATLEIDFETEVVTKHQIQHQFWEGTWWPKADASTVPNVGAMAPSHMVSTELTEFLDCVRARRRPAANEVASGLVLARIVEGIYESAARNSPVYLHWSTDEIESMKVN